MRRGRESGRCGRRPYEVHFNQDVSNCAYIGTVGLATTAGLPNAAFVAVAPRLNNVDAVFVKAYDKTGAGADESLHLAVFCW